MESLEFDIASGYASSSKVPSQSIEHEAKWEAYSAGLQQLDVPDRLVSHFLSRVCAAPCHPSIEPLEGWKLILPCLKQPQDWELPTSCWNEAEKALRQPQRRTSLLRGLACICRECPEQVADWLRFSPHNFLRAARRLGLFSPDRALTILEKASHHPLWMPLARPYRFASWAKKWGPLRLPEWFREGLQGEGAEDWLAQEFSKRRPLLQLDLLYRLLRS